VPTRDTLGGIVHSYQRYDPARVPPPRPPATDLVTPAVEHLLEFGEAGELTEEQLAEAIVLDPEQIRGLGPSLDAIRRRLEEARRKILETYETDSVRKRARRRFHDAARRARPPERFREGFAKAVREEQVRQLERLWYAQADDQSPFAADLAGLVDRLGEVYQLDELAAGWTFTGRQKLDVDEALEVKARLEEIEELLRQLDEARRNSKVAVIDMEALGQYLEQGEREELELLRRQVREAVERLAAEQGLEKTARRLRAHAAGAADVPGEAARADLRRPRPLADGPPSGRRAGRGGGGDGAHAALRVWRFDRPHGHSRLAGELDPA